ncbi:DUF58 domain-containing protein [Haloimpatiens lingqiaonensis]|uniref:DUF58 domain-containing protein n=1 Tax=Haloimpatiens lingqiaonensis TaxID=1380675 RepID=UPI0014857A59|nr:DUF58 domain-containing protein [Haloimpatiens lingqiaonensis]
MIKISKKFILILIISLIVAIVLGGNFPYAVFYAFVVTLVLELIYIYKVAHKLHIAFKGKNNSYTAGESDNLEILVKNYSIPYLYLFNSAFKLFDKNYNGHCVYVDSNKSEIINLNLTFSSRGVFDLGKFNVISYDLFNIFSLKKEYYVEDKKIKVYPKIYPIDGKWFFGDGTCDSRNINRNFNEDTSLIKDIRKYVSGDSLKRVHWKLSAKHRQLYVKNFESTSGKLGNIFLNMSTGSYSADNGKEMEDKCIEIAASLINYMIDNGIKSKILISDSKESKLEIYNHQSFNEFMEDMVKEKSDGDIEFCDFININIKHVSYRGIIYIITPQIHKKLCDTIYSLINKNYKVVLLYGLKEAYNSEDVQSLDKIGVKTININNIIQSKLS